MKLSSTWYWVIICGLLATMPTQTAAQAQGHPLPQPESMTVDRSLSKADAAQMIKTARLFYAFWDTGKAEYASAAVDNDFRDNTLPEGRPQGPEGLLYASQAFRSAVPDLHCTIEDLLVSGDKITARLLFTGTHKGERRRAVILSPLTSRSSIVQRRSGTATSKSLRSVKQAFGTLRPSCRQRVITKIVVHCGRRILRVSCIPKRIKQTRRFDHLRSICRR